jgi:hypothetical protein
MSSGPWYVLIEEQVGYGGGIRWHLAHSIPASGPEHAAEMACHLAVNHLPTNPRMPKSRAVFRSPDGSWLVNVEGATMSFHFRVSIAEYFGIYPGNPSA